MRAGMWFGAAALVALLSQVVYAQNSPTLLEARSGFETTLTRIQSDRGPLEPPPEALFSIVKFDTQIGKMHAYLSVAPGPGKHPAIIWITGGFPAGGIGSDAWEPSPIDNDQSAKSYRESGVVTMYPTLRGSFGNPGHQETFYGEVNDILSALEYLSKVDYVDADRIYLGGHSTGGTLVLLVAAATDRFRGIFSFGAVSRAADYGDDLLTYSPDDERENALRSPIEFLDAIRSPTWVIEGTEGGNIDSLYEMRRETSNAKVHFEPVHGATHFDVLAPVNRLVAKKIAMLEDNAEFSLNSGEIQAAIDDLKVAAREASDLSRIASLRHSGTDIGALVTTQHYLFAREREPLATAARQAVGKGFTQKQLSERKDRNSRRFFVLVLTKKLTLRDLDAVFTASKAITELSIEHRLHYEGWDVE